MDNTGNEQKSNLRAAQERIAALQHERQQQMRAAIKPKQAAQAVEKERKLPATVLAFGGWAAALRELQDAEAHVYQERASLDETDAAHAGTTGSTVPENNGSVE